MTTATQPEYDQLWSLPWTNDFTSGLTWSPRPGQLTGEGEVQIVPLTRMVWQAVDEDDVLLDSPDWVNPPWRA
jgi:hypothetical protein